MPRRILQGTVVSDKADKTVVVRVERRVRHPIYKKFISQSKKYMAHDEANRFKKAPGSFRDSPLGNDTKDALQLARDIAVRNAGTLAKERYQRNLDELNEHLRDSAKILIDITSAKRNQLDQAIAGSQVTAKESERNIVKADDEHVIWPFDGEYWRDELGFYRQTITSKCGR